MPDAPNDIFHLKTDDVAGDDFFDALEQTEPNRNNGLPEAVRALRQGSERDEVLNWTTAEQQDLRGRIERAKPAEYLSLLESELTRERQEKNGYMEAYLKLEGIRFTGTTVNGKRKKVERPRAEIEAAFDAILLAKEKILRHPEFRTFTTRNPEAFAKLDLAADLFYALAAKESAFRRNLVSSSGAFGLLQLAREANGTATAAVELARPKSPAHLLTVPQLVASAGKYKTDMTDNAVIGILYQLLLQQKTAVDVGAYDSNLSIALYNLGEGNFRAIWNTMEQAAKKDAALRAGLGNFRGWERLARYLSFILEKDFAFVTRSDSNNLSEISYRSWAKEEGQTGSLSFTNHQGKRYAIERKKLIQTLRYTEIVAALRQHARKSIAPPPPARQETPPPPQRSPSIDSAAVRGIKMFSGKLESVETKIQPSKKSPWQLANDLMDSDLKLQILQIFKISEAEIKRDANTKIREDVRAQILRTILAYQETRLGKKTTPRTVATDESGKIAILPSFLDNEVLLLPPRNVFLQLLEQKQSSKFEKQLQSKESVAVLQGKSLFSLLNEILNSPLSSQIAAASGLASADLLLQDTKSLESRQEARYRIATAILKYNAQHSPQRALWAQRRIGGDANGFFIFIPALAPTEEILLPSTTDFLNLIRSSEAELARLEELPYAEDARETAFSGKLEDIPLTANLRTGSSLATMWQLGNLLIADLELKGDSFPERQRIRQNIAQLVIIYNKVNNDQNRKLWEGRRIVLNRGKDYEVVPPIVNEPVLLPSRSYFLTLFNKFSPRAALDREIIPAPAAEALLPGGRSKYYQEILGEKIDVVDQKLKGCFFVLDPGHGGTDPGAGPQKVDEAPHVLDITYRLAREIIRHGGDVELTHYSQMRKTSSAEKLERVTGVYSDTKSPVGPAGIKTRQRRREIANATFFQARNYQRKIFLSLHADSTQSGATLPLRFFYNEGDRASKQFGDALALATHSQARKQNGEVRINWGNRPVPLVNLYKKYDARSPQGRPALATVLKNNIADAELIVEVANLNSTDDLGKIQNPQGRQQYAEQIANGLIKWYQ